MPDINPLDELWEVGGPYPGVSVIYCVDGGCTHPDHAEPPQYEPACIIDQNIRGEQNPEALSIAERIVAEHNALLGIADPGKLRLELLDLRDIWAKYRNKEAALISVMLRVKILADMLQPTQDPNAHQVPEATPPT